MCANMQQSSGCGGHRFATDAGYSAPQMSTRSNSCGSNVGGNNFKNSQQQHMQVCRLSAVVPRPRSRLPTMSLARPTLIYSRSGVKTPLRVVCSQLAAFTFLILVGKGIMINRAILAWAL
jgi:hypothetical protein